MLYLIGLGLNIDGISTYGMEVARRCKRVYIENYTVDFPYQIEEFRHILDKKLIEADREKVEGLSIIDEAKKMDIALLVYGSPLFATTHITLLQEAKASGVKTRIIHGASVFDAIGQTGLQLYKFGKIASLPNLDADSYTEIIKENKSIKAHSLILVDIGMSFKDAFDKLIKDAEKNKLKLGKMIVCSKIGTKRKKIFYDKIENLKEKEIDTPFCFVVPSKLHFMEKEFLEC